MLTPRPGGCLPIHGAAGAGLPVLHGHRVPACPASRGGHSARRRRHRAARRCRLTRADYHWVMAHVRSLNRQARPSRGWHWKRATRLRCRRPLLGSTNKFHNRTRLASESNPPRPQLSRGNTARRRRSLRSHCGLSDRSRRATPASSTARALRPRALRPHTARASRPRARTSPSARELATRQPPAVLLTERPAGAAGRPAGRAQRPSSSGAVT